jgi:hypothetical protein
MLAALSTGISGLGGLLPGGRLPGVRFSSPDAFRVNWPTQTTSGPAFVGELEPMHAAVGRNEDMYATVSLANSHEAQNS